MRRFLGLLISVGLLALCAIPAAGQAVPKSIFDDDGDHPFERPDQAQPAPQPAPAPAPDNSAPAPAPATGADSGGTVAPPPPVPPAVVHAVLVAVPAAEAQRASLKLIDELYKDDISNATTPELKIELAKKLLGVAQGTTDDPVGKYVLLATAKEVAISSGDPPTAFKCLDEMAQGYQVDYVGMKLDLFTRLADYVKSAQDQQTYVEGLNHWMDEQVAVDHYDSAKKAGDLALLVALRSRDAWLQTMTTAHVARIAEIAGAYAEVRGAVQTLARLPNDAAANLAVGRFYCFMKGDWKRGLPMLSMADDAGLCAAAERELAGATDSNSQVAIGDGWWDLAVKESGRAQQRMREHAAGWYEMAVGQLTGAAKDKVENRVAELATLYPQESSGQEMVVEAHSVEMPKTTIHFEDRFLPQLVDMNHDVLMEAGKSCGPGFSLLIGEAGGQPFLHVSPKMKTVVGFQWNSVGKKYRFLTKLDPIFDREAVAAGQQFPAGSGIVMAKKGYVVSGILANPDPNVHAVRAVKVIFTACDDAGKLDYTQTYFSDTCGQWNGDLCVLGGHGEIVCGTYGSSDGKFMYNLGLLFCVPDSNGKVGMASKFPFEQVHDPLLAPMIPNQVDAAPVGN